MTKDLIARNFTRGSQNYDSIVRVQKQITQDLVSSFNESDLSAGAILDIGCGTGALTDALSKAHPNGEWEKRVTGLDMASGMVRFALKKYPAAPLVQGDMHHLPFKPDSFDLVLSASVFQWALPLEDVLTQMLQAVKPKGAFKAAFFTQGTLEELHQSYLIATGEKKFPHVYATKERVNSWIRNNRVTNASVRVRQMTETYDSVKHLIKSLNAIGANNSTQAQNNLMFSPKKFKRLVDAYVSGFSTGNGIRATYKCITLKGEKSGPILGKECGKIRRHEDQDHLHRPLGFRGHSKRRCCGD